MYTPSLVNALTRINSLCFLSPRLSDFIMLETYLFNGTEVAQATVVAPLEDVVSDVLVYHIRT